MNKLLKRIEELEKRQPATPGRQFKDLSEIFEYFRSKRPDIFGEQNHETN